MIFSRYLAYIRLILMIQDQFLQFFRQFDKIGQRFRGDQELFTDPNPLLQNWAYV